MGQENPWKTNNQENTSESLRGENPWISNNPSKEVESANQIKEKKNSRINAVNFGFNEHKSPAGVAAPALIGSIPVLGILTIPLMPLFTAVKAKNKEKIVADSYLRKYPEAEPQEIIAVKKGVQRKRWRNTGIGMGIGAVGQALILFLIIEAF